MKGPVATIFWLDGGSSMLSALPWRKLDGEGARVASKPFYWDQFDTDEVNKAGQQAQAVVIFDLDDDTGFKDLNEKFFKSLQESVLIFVLVPPMWLKQAKKLTASRENAYSLQKPVRTAEFFLLLEKSILLEQQKKKREKAEEEEIQWLQRIEKVFEFSRKELLEKEATANAFEQLVDYEQQLLTEQKRINKALLLLQEFRDSEKSNWLKEKDAREKLESLMESEIKSKDDTLKAQESLLQYVFKEKAAFERILKEYEEKGELSREAINKLIEGQKLLMQQLDSVQ